VRHTGFGDCSYAHCVCFLDSAEIVGNNVSVSYGSGKHTANVISAIATSSSGVMSSGNATMSDDDDSGDDENTESTKPFHSAHDVDGDIRGLSVLQQSPRSSLLAGRRALVVVDADLLVSHLSCHGLPVAIEKVDRSISSMID
jgi:hypothetical protein